MNKNITENTKIDFHVHITPPDIAANWKKYTEKEPYFSLLSNSKNNKFACAEDVIAEMEKEKIDYSVVFGFAFRDIGLCRYVNDYVIEKTRQFPDKLIGFAVTAPGNEAAKEIERCYKSGLKGTGELFPKGQGFDLEDSKYISEITEVCKEYDIPLLLHFNEPVGHYYPGKTETSLKQIETFVTNNPEIKIVLAHFGGGLLFYETMKEIKEKFRNVYYDTAASVFIYNSGIYIAVKALGLCGKLLFGSDFPLITPSRYYNDIEDAGFSDEEKKLFMGINAQKILGLYK